MIVTTYRSLQVSNYEMLLRTLSEFTFFLLFDFFDWRIPFLRVLSICLLRYTAELNSTRWLFFLDPNKPTVTCQGLEMSIAVEVSGPVSGGVEKYAASCSDCNVPQKKERAAAGGSVVNFHYDQLENGVEYRVEVLSVFGTKQSEIQEVNCTAGEGGKLLCKIIQSKIHCIADADFFFTVLLLLCSPGTS